jgi:hypothetical protein
MGDKTPVEDIAEIGVPYEILLSGVRLALAENGTEQPNYNDAGTD